jgi:beta-glucosidase
MVPYDARKFIATVKKAVKAGDIPMERIDDAVSRILRVKFEMGLFESPMANRTLAATIRSPAHLALAREAVAKSLVLLKNDHALPLGKKLSRLYVAGSAADDVGIQCGGWTIEWQGKEGKITEGTTILDGIKQKVSAQSVVYERGANFKGADRSAPCVVVIGEKPYAEWEGDNAEIALSSDDLETIAQARSRFKKVIVVLISGRPLVLGSSLAKCDAFVAAWLPGTEGAGVADVLFGDAAVTGKLPFDWPSSADQMPLERFASGEQKPLFPVGFGLRY